MQALQLIGKQVVAEGNTVNYAGTNEDLNFNLGETAANVTVKIYNSSGKLVRTGTMTSVAEGEAKYAWDGKDSQGNTVSQGKYYFTVAATDINGDSVTATTFAKGQVTGVKYDSGNTYLTIGNKDVSLADIQKISE
jgi:flagellar basal-body rod modification protein FlgD